MKLLPSIAFNDFSGSAGNVTARKTGDRTILSTRTKHSKKKTTYQASTRCRFADTTRGYSKITEELRQGWISLAKNLGTYQTSTGNTSITGHNLFVAINSYRKICGKPQTAIAPPELRPSDYIRFDDFWLSPDNIIFTGLGERENTNEVLYVEMYAAQSPAESRCWDKTTLVAICPTTDWGEIDLTRAFIEKFGTPLTIGQNVFIKICWLDSECGYIKYFTLIARSAQEGSLLRNLPLKPRIKITTDNISYNGDANESECEYLDYELTTESKISSIDFIGYFKGEHYSPSSLNFKSISYDFGICNSLQFARADIELNHVIHFLSITVYYCGAHFLPVSGLGVQRFESFGTYHTQS